MGNKKRRGENRSSEAGASLVLLAVILAVAAVATVVIIAVMALMPGLGGGSGSGTATQNGVQSTGLSNQGAAADDPSTPHSGAYSTASDMRGYTDDLDVAALDAKLAAKGSPLAGHAQEIDDTAKQYNLDPALYASLIMEESGWGTNRATSQYNNCTSVMTGADASQFKQFDSYQAAMNYTANSLCNGNNYFTQGRTTLGSVGAVYAPSGASNDPNNTNGGWATDIATIANNQIPKKTPTGGG